MKNANAVTASTASKTTKHNQTQSVESNIVNHNLSTDFQRKEVIALCDSFATTGKNALLIKAFIQDKKNAKLDVLHALKYDFQSIAIAAAISGSQFKNKMEKLTKVIQEDSLFTLSTVVGKLVAKPSATTAQAVIDFFATTNAVKYRIIDKVDASTIDSIKQLASGLPLLDWSAAAPMWLTVNIDINGNLIEKLKANSKAELDTDQLITALVDRVSNDDDKLAMLVKLADKLGLDLGFNTVEIDTVNDSVNDVVNEDGTIAPIGIPA